MIKQLLRKNFVLIAILLAALFIRVIGVNPGYPPYHPDEPMSYSSAIEMIINGDLDPRRYDYPAGVPLLHWFFFKIFFLPLALFKLFFPHPRVFLTALRIGNQFLAEFRQPIFGHREISALFFSRYLTAFLGTGVVFLTYLLGKRLFGGKAGLIAAFFTAFNYRHVLSGHLALSDIPNCFFALLAVYACLLLFEKNSCRNYLLAGLTCGLFLSMKYQFFPIFTFLLVHLIWVFREKSFSALFNKYFILGAFLIPIIFVILNPYLFLHLKQALPVIKYVSLRYGMGVKKFNFYSLFYLYHWGIGNLPSLAIIGGLILAVILRPLKTLFLVSFILPFFYIFIYYARGGTYVRNFTTAIPFLLIFAGFFFGELFRLAKKITHWKVYILIPLTIILVFLVNFESIKNSATLAYFYTKPWSFTRLTNWLVTNLPFGVQVGSHSVVDFPEDRKVNRTDWPVWGETSLSELRERGDQFAVMNLDFYHVLLFDWFNLPPSKMIKYSGIPYDYLSETFPGLAQEEWLNYTVGEFFKPWQAYDLNYLVFKIPPSLDAPGRKITTFDFNNDEEGWRVKGMFGQKTEGFGWSNKEGRFKKGSLEISQEASGFPTAHFSSPPIPIKPGKYYTFSGWLKNSVNLDSRNRDGFLRVDFYKDKADAQIGRNRLSVALSSRVFETTEWVEKKATAVVSNEANYVVLGFQRNNLSSEFSSYLDEVVLFESDTLPKENFPAIPYIQTKISEKELYPNSIL